MKLFLYTNTFMHDGHKLMSASVGVRRGEIDCVGMISLPFYLHADNMYDGAMGLMSLTLSTETLLENLGNTVEIEDVLKSSVKIVDHLRWEYAK